MNKILVFLSLVGLNAYAFENCLNLPVTAEQKPYLGKITDVSDILSYKGCPASTLVNDHHIANLERVTTFEGKTACIYGFNSISFQCSL